MNRLAIASALAAATLALASPAFADHHEEADGCDHGATSKTCRPDPQPDKGKDCEKHGNHGGINEDHCGPTPSPTTTGGTPSPSSTTHTPSVTHSPSPSQTSSMPTTAPTDPSSPTSHRSRSSRPLIASIAPSPTTAPSPLTSAPSSTDAPPDRLARTGAALLPALALAGALLFLGIASLVFRTRRNGGGQP